MSEVESNIEIVELEYNGSSFIPYSVFHSFMLGKLEERIQDQIPDTIYICEHEPVITRGKGLQDKSSGLKSMPLPIVPPGTQFQEVERGGDLTWHGPGQLMIYPIVKLGDPRGFYPKQDLGGFLRALEQLVIDVLQKQEVESFTIAGATGVWVKRSQQNYKIASIGIALKKWVSYHGIGLNIHTNLEVFKSFSPCGFSSEVMTNLLTLKTVKKHS